MGWGVWIDGSVEPLLEKMEEKPYSIFDGIYSGYLLFLVGEGDRKIIDWLKENITTLDSLTANEVAFVVFARKINVKIHCPDTWESRAPGNRGSANLSKVKNRWELNRLVKSGSFGFVVDGDELAAITYAVDDIARHFGVIEDLPAIIVLDAIPFKAPFVLRLNQENLENILPMLRKAIGELGKASKRSRLIEKVNSFSITQKDIESRIVQLERDKRSLEYFREQMKQEREVHEKYLIPFKNNKGGYFATESYMMAMRGQRTLFVELTEKFTWLNEVDRQDLLSKRKKLFKEVNRCRRIRDSLESIQKTEGELNQGQEKGFAYLLNAANELLCLPECPLPDRCEIPILQKQLDKKMEPFKEEMFAKIVPTKDQEQDALSNQIQLLETNISRLDEKASELDIHIETQEDEIKELDQKLLKLAEDVKLCDVSLGDILSKVTKGENYRSLQEQATGVAKDFMFGLFKPDFVLKLLKYLNV